MVRLRHLFVNGYFVVPESKVFCLGHLVFINRHLHRAPGATMISLWQLIGKDWLMPGNWIYLRSRYRWSRQRLWHWNRLFVPW